MAEGVGISNSRESKYSRNTGFQVQNTILKMAKKRALVDAALNVGNLSARFTQDLEDMNVGKEHPYGIGFDELHQNPLGNDDKDVERNGSPTGQAPIAYNGNPSASKPATAKQIAFLEKLMFEHHNTSAAMNAYVTKAYGVDDCHNLTSRQASEVIEKYKGAGR